MKLKVSKTILNEIKKYFKNDNNCKNYSFEYVEMSPRAYMLNVDYDADDLDFDHIKNIYKTIRVIYPCNYYACDSYITTKMLVKAYKRGNTTLKTIFEYIKREIEI